MTGEARTVLGLTAESWAIGCFSVVVIAICCQELGRFLAHLSAAYPDAPDDGRPSSLPSFSNDTRFAYAKQAAHVEARKARSGVWK